MNTKQTEALKLALEALECDPLDMALNPDGHMGFRKDKAITAIREALAERQQEPFGYFRYDLRLDAWVQNREGRPGTPFYTSPPASKPLTDEEISNLWCEVSNTDFVTADTHEFARAIEAAHGIK